MRVEGHPAYILHHYPFRDSSEIVELLTRDFGRLSVVSRGSRGPRNRFKTLMQPFQLLHASWSGKGEMPSLTHVEAAVQKPLILTGQYLVSGFYINELLMHFLHRHDVQDDVFVLYYQTLQRLSEHVELEIILRVFEKHLLQCLGLGLNLDTDADSGMPVKPDQQYLYQVEHGPVVALSNEISSQLPRIKGESLLAFEREQLDNELVRREIKQLMRYVIGFYLAGKKLKSRELFRP